MTNVSEGPKTRGFFISPKGE